MSRKAERGGAAFDGNAEKARYEKEGPGLSVLYSPTAYFLVLGARSFLRPAVVW